MVLRDFKGLTSSSAFGEYETLINYLLFYSGLHKHLINYAFVTGKYYLFQIISSKFLLLLIKAM